MTSVGGGTIKNKDIFILSVRDKSSQLTGHYMVLQLPDVIQAVIELAVIHGHLAVLYHPR